MNRSQYNHFGPRSKRMTATFAAGAIALAVAACGGSSNSNTGGSSAGTSGGANPKTVSIGVVMSETGDGAAFGAAQAEGAELIANYINDHGGIKALGGAKINVIVKDSQSNPTVAAQDLRQLAQQGVSAFCGPLLSTEVAANTPLINSLKIPVFTGAGVAGTAKTPSANYLFNTSSETAKASLVTVKYVQQLIKSGQMKNVKVGIMDTSVPPGSTVTAPLTAALKAAGIPIATTIVYNPVTTTDFSPIVQKLQNAGANLVMGFQLPNDMINFAKAVQTSGWKPSNGVLGAGSGTFLDSVRAAGGATMDGWMTSAFASNLSSSYYPASVNQLAAAFQKKYHASMEGTSATVGATDMAVAVDAIAAAKSANPQKVAAAARTLRFSTPKQSLYPYTTPGGVAFTTSQNNAAIVIPIIQAIKGGGFITVYPASVATGKLQPLN